jgi:hypothetical protein
MDTYTTRIGSRRAKTPARDLYSIATRERADDGTILVHAGASDCPPCPDCGRGRLQWAEAGYVSWHRICDTCGSHWDLHPITWGPARPSRPIESPRAQHDDGCDVYWEDDEYPSGRPCSCGAHDELGPALVAHAELVARSRGLVRWVDGRGEVALDCAARVGRDGEGPTWGEFVDRLTPEMWAAAEAEQSRMADIVVVPCCWARRARFYEGRR